MTAPAVIVTPLTPSAAAAGMDKAASSAEPVIARLTSGLAAGEDEAFRQFHAAYFDRLLRYLFVVTHGDEHAAREALQETMTRVIRYARRFDSEEVFWSWLTVLARSAVADVGRKRQRYWRVIKEYALSWISPSDDSSRDADFEADLLRLLRERLNQLQPLDRDLMEGKYLRECSVRELAEQFQLTERAVESRLLRARRQLRAELLGILKHEKRD